MNLKRKSSVLIMSKVNGIEITAVKMLSSMMIKLTQKTECQKNKIILFFYYCNALMVSQVKFAIIFS